MLSALRQSIDQPWLDLNLPGGNRLVVRIVERPACWMSADLLAALRHDLRTVTQSALGNQELDYGIFDPTSDALQHTIVTCIYR